MKISNAIVIIALCAQGFFLHADAAYNNNKLRLRGSGGEPSNTDNVGYRGGPSNTETVLAQRLARRDDKKAQSTDNVGYGGESGVGAYLQTQIASRHGERCRFPAPKCGSGSTCRDRYGDLKPICVDDDKCVPDYTFVSPQGVGNFRCCSRYAAYSGSGDLCLPKPFRGGHI